ncbi:hypothetical protein D083_0192 [Dickeya solani RNS 08.23.3.1.A]|nr:hypothetical protein D083_0192 [Dickeya solani RNS 08.23.3.1.A]
MSLQEPLCLQDDIGYLIICSGFLSGRLDNSYIFIVITY